MTEPSQAPTNENESASRAQQPQNDNSQETPRISSASPASGGGDKEDSENIQESQDLTKIQGITASLLRDRKPPTPSRHSSTAADEEDETRSTTTDSTELSTRAQAGSEAPSSAPSPAPSTEVEPELTSSGVGADDPSDDRDREKSDADASPFLHDDHSSAKKPSPPQINLAPRTHPLAGGEAQHGGFLLREERQAELDDERAQGTREPAYDDAPEFKPNFEQDTYSSDEASDEANGGKMKKLKKRIKGEAKVLSGKIRRDEGKLEEGKKMINTT